MTIETQSRLNEAAVWLATTPESAKPRPVIAHLKKQFGLTPLEAVKAIEESNLIRARAI